MIIVEIKIDNCDDFWFKYQISGFEIKDIREFNLKEMNLGRFSKWFYFGKLRKGNKVYRLYQHKQEIEPDFSFSLKKVSCGQSVTISEEEYLKLNPQIGNKIVRKYEKDNRGTYLEKINKTLTERSC